MELRSHVNIKMFILYLMYWVLFRIDPFQHPEWVLNKSVDVSTGLGCLVRESFVLFLSSHQWSPHIYLQLFSAPNCVHLLNLFLWLVFSHTSTLPSACPLLPQFYTLASWWWWWWWWCLGYCTPSCSFYEIPQYLIFIASNCFLLH